ncbi:MAG: helix-turn-helix domain-containing protein [Dysosmobacter welbionis]
MDATARPGYAETTKTKRQLQWHSVPSCSRCCSCSGHLGRLIYLLILLIRALRKYLRAGGPAEKAETRRTLGEVLKAHRMRCQMTQEFVAEALGSAGRRSAMETGTDPSTSNLLALAKPSVCQRRSCCGRPPPAEQGRERPHEPVTICNRAVMELRGKFPAPGLSCKTQIKTE